MADDAWVRIPPPSFRQRLAVGGLWFFVVAWVGLQPMGWLGEAAAERLGGGLLTEIVTAVVGLAALAALVLLVLTRLTPVLGIHAERGLLRLRGAERPFTDLVGARVETSADLPESRYDRPRRRPRRDRVVLRLDLRGGGHALLVLSVGDTDLLSAEQTAALLAAVRGSAIVAPTASYDPDGRFTHLNFPGRLDLEETVRLVEDPQRARAIPR